MQADPARFAYMVLEHVDLGRVLRLSAAVRRRSSTASVLLCFTGPLSGSQRAQLAAAGITTVGSGARVLRGDTSLLDRTMEGLQQALELEWDWLAVVSGQDYPTGDLRTWELSVATSGVDAVNAAEPAADHDRELVQRYGFRWWVLRRSGAPLGLLDRVLLRVVRGAARRWSSLSYRPSEGDHWIGLRRRDGWPTGLWKGDFWTAVDRATARAVLDEHRSGDLERRLRRTMFPEEVFMPTVLRRLSARVRCQSVTLTQWPADGSSHPRDLRMADLPLLLATDSPFARKFTGSDREQLLQALDARVTASPHGGDPPLWYEHRTAGSSPHRA